ncbi:MAG: glycosyltransferase family 39 protein [Planctomycetes bacterium]|nr:glycosyltransferase family 39 protein [Planctomycetota bacterium]
MIERFHNRGGHYALLLAMAGLVFFVNLGAATLWDMDEGKNTTCAYEMLMSGNWIVPTFNGNLRVDKPVLLYWLQIFSYLTFGVNEFAGRFPSAVAALCTVLLAYELARSMFSRTTGLLAGVIAATSPMLCGAARFANPDALLNCFTVLTFTLFWLGLARRSAGWFALLGISMGLAMLAKGPVGIVLPMAVIALFLIWERRWAVLFDWRWCITYGVFILTGLPWYILVAVETKGEFLRGFFLKHNLERGMSALENHHGFPGYYVVVLFVGMLPWSVFQLAAWWFGFWSAIRSPWERARGLWASVADQNPQGDAADAPAAYRLLACWIAVYLIFFSVAATKLPNYALPAVIPCCVLMGRFLQRWRAGSLPIPAWYTYACAACFLLIGVGLTVGLLVADGVWEWPMLRGRHFPGLAAWAFLGAVPVLAGLACWHFGRMRQPTRLVTTVAAAALVLLAPVVGFGSGVFNQRKAPQPLVEETGSLRLDADIRVGCWQMEHLPSLNFYLKRSVEHLHDEPALASLLQSRLPVYVFIPMRDWQNLETSRRRYGRIIGRHYDMFHHTEIVVVTNQMP